MFVHEENARVYEKRYAGGIHHDYPNVNSVRIAKGFFPPKGRVLDYGFGYGQEVVHFLKKGHEVWGLDVSKTAKIGAYDKIQSAGIPLSLAHLEVVDPAWSKLPYKDNFFDAIHSNQTVYFLGDRDKIDALIQEFNRILKPGGKLYVSLIGPESSIVTEGKKVGENQYTPNWPAGKGYNENETRVCYLFKDEAAIKKAFSMFRIVEIGSFNNVYLGVNGFHWVVLAEKIMEGT